MQSMRHEKTLYGMLEGNPDLIEVNLLWTRDAFYKECARLGGR